MCALARQNVDGPQSHFLARRLVEAGTRFVTTVNAPSIIWDTHKDNFDGLQNKLVPPMEQALAALLDDLEERGLFESTLVVWMGEFGRTPKINVDAGRDHWPGCHSVVMAGGGVCGGPCLELPTRSVCARWNGPLRRRTFTPPCLRPSAMIRAPSPTRRQTVGPIRLTEGSVLRELF